MSPGRVQARRRLAVSLTRGDEAGSWAIVQAALAQGAKPIEAYMDLIAPALSAIGDQWEAASTTVGEEHAATAVATRLIGRMGPLFRPAGRPRGLLISGAVAGERHALPGALLADILRSAGFQVLDLGSDTPIESFLERVRGAARLVAVLVGATMPDRQDQIRATVSALHQATAAPVFAGGAAVPSRERADELGADGWSGLDARAALAAVDGLAAVEGLAAGRQGGAAEDSDRDG